MTHQVAHDDGGYQCFRVVNGRYRLDCGPTWATPSAAAIYCDALDLAARSAPLSGEGAGQNGLPVPAEARVSQGAHGAPRLPAPAASDWLPRRPPEDATGRDNASR